MENQRLFAQCLHLLRDVSPPWHPKLSCCPRQEPTEERGDRLCILHHRFVALVNKLRLVYSDSQILNFQSLDVEHMLTILLLLIKFPQTQVKIVFIILGVQIQSIGLYVYNQCTSYTFFNNTLLYYNVLYCMKDFNLSFQHAILDAQGWINNLALCFNQINGLLQGLLWP